MTRTELSSKVDICPFVEVFGLKKVIKWIGVDRFVCALIKEVGANRLMNELIPTLTEAERAFLLRRLKQCDKKISMPNRR